MFPDVLSNIDIDTVLNNFSGYIGCFCKDELKPLKIPKNQTSFAVINAGDRSTGGSHWRCYFNDPNDEHINYFDPYGVVPDANTLTFLKKSKKKILYNTSQLQDIESTACGYYCLYFILSRIQNKPMYDIVMNLKQNGGNEEFIQGFRNKLNNLF